jgi:hypothetical protein
MTANGTKLDEVEARLGVVLAGALAFWALSFATLAAIPFLLVGGDREEA